MASVSSLLESVNWACDRWKIEGSDKSAVEKLRDELYSPGGKAGVVCRFIGGEYAGAGVDFEAVLAKKLQLDEVDNAFDRVLDFLRGLGRPGAELARSLRSANGGRQ